MKRNAERIHAGKRKIFPWIAVFGLILFLLCVRYVYRGDRYLIYGQFSFGGGEYRQTTMNVIVNRNVREEQIMEEIIDEYLRVNADNCADKIILRLYRSRRALKDGKFFRELVLSL